MNRWRTFAVAGTIATGLAGAATPTVLAGEPAVEVATTTTAAPFTLPAGYQVLVDDTDRIQIAVPPTWTDIDTTALDVDGAVVPAISAATDLEVWDDTFDAPGVLYAAFPYTADPQTLVDRYALTSGCATTTTVPYSDGVFSGLWGQWAECGLTKLAEWHLIVASPVGQEFTALVVTQLTGPQDQEAFDVVRETFNVTPSATWPATPAAPATTAVPATSVAPTTTAAVPVPPSTVAPPTTTGVPVTTAVSVTTAVTATTAVAPTTGVPTTAAAPGVRLVDNTGFLTVTVPGDWVDQNLSRSRRDDGSDRATITAAPSIDDYFSSWEGSGTYVIALPATADAAALLDRFGFPNACTDGGVTPFDDGRFTGQQQVWVDCGGTATRVTNVAARPPDNSFTLFIQVQQTVADDAQLAQILGSAGSVPGESYPTLVDVPPLVPVGAVSAELLTPPAVPLATVTDRTDTLAFSVPSAWTDVDDGPAMNDDGSDRPQLTAAPVLDDFYTDWSAPGTTVVAYPFTANPSVLLHNLGFDEQCDDGGVQSFSNGALTGLMQTWTNCGGTASRNVLLAVSPADQSATVYIEVQLPDADNTPLQAVLSSLQVS
jgi:hypothetical protein